MFKISLYQFLCVSLCKHIKAQSYRKNQSYTTDRQETSATRRGLLQRQEPHFPYALPSSTEGYVPYGWQFLVEEVYISSERGIRLNIFGMIDRNNRYDGFSTTENMTAEKISDFLDRLSMRIYKNTFVVLDNASVHRCRLMRELRLIWEKRGLFLFFLPSYNPHLNIAETLWRILKGKWLRPVDYFSTDFLLYATNRALAALGCELNINFAHAA